MDKVMFECLMLARQRAWDEGRDDIAWSISAAIGMGHGLSHAATKDALKWAWECHTQSSLHKPGDEV